MICRLKFVYERKLICLQDVCHDMTERTLLNLFYQENINFNTMYSVLNDVMYVTYNIHLIG